MQRPGSDDARLLTRDARSTATSHQPPLEQRPRRGFVNLFRIKFALAGAPGMITLVTSAAHEALHRQRNSRVVKSVRVPDHRQTAPNSFDADAQTPTTFGGCYLDLPSAARYTRARISRNRQKATPAANWANAVLLGRRQSRRQSQAASSSTPDRVRPGRYAEILRRLWSECPPTGPRRHQK